MLSGLRGVMAELLLLVAVLISTVPVPTAAQNNKAISDFLYVLPLIITTIVIIGIAILVICVMYRAKKGYFCCLSPTPYRYPQSAVDDSGSEASVEQNTPESLPPTYHTNQVQPPVNIAPPDYRDAMQDPLVASGSPQDQAVSPNGETETALRSPVSPTPPPAASESTTEAVEEPQTNDGPQQEGFADVGIELDDGSDSLEDANDRTPLNP